jgi:peptidoglycan/LPS O-acetylase OafA/YrhL
VFHHYQQISDVNFRGGVNFYGGKFAFGFLVELFFMISGFLTAYSSIKNKTFLTWIKNKTSRIYPFAIPSIMVMLIVSYLYHYMLGEWLYDWNYGMANIITSFLLVNQGWIIEYAPAVNNPIWYLCVLVVCYILYYAVDWIDGKSKHDIKIIIYLVIILISVVVYRFHGNWEVAFWHLSNARGYSSFFMGCLLCLLYQKTTTYKLRIIYIGLFAASIVGFVVKGLSCWYVLTFLAYPALVLLVVTEKQVKWGTLSFLGGASFEMYLWHLPLYSLLKLIFDISNIQFEHTYFTMICFAFVVEVVAVIIFAFIEKPCLKLLRKT